MVIKWFSLLSLLVLASLIRHYSLAYFCGVLLTIAVTEKVQVIPLPLIISKFFPCLWKGFWIIWEAREFCTCFYPLFMCTLNYTQPPFQAGRWLPGIFVSGNWVSVVTIVSRLGALLPLILVLRRDMVLLGHWSPISHPWRVQFFFILALNLTGGACSML